MALSNMLAACIAMTLLLAASAHPELWVTDFARACTDHPVVGSQYRNHFTAVDSSNTFAITVGGKAVTKMCPGAQHAVTVAFGGQTRQGLFTSSLGSFSSPYNSACPNRVLLDAPPYYDDSVASSYTNTLTLPCTATGSVVLKVTSTSSRRGTLSETTATLAVDPTCAATTCRKSPPPLKKSPPPKTVGRL